ncbi:esterase-like activity of phytase family protein [Sphingomonas hankookensis]|uniref:esterase-like activity of phytase family protein n=1 Tax=Sphingomonas hankookensis TaxID=563996 RepID=UPI00234F6D95|nr:esterase-like activity of phytase family protein [Sphingomonas hankookensis]WCP71948.1 esterase-like activity of phytase family protein [Sphingomonas hankookensis]
MRILFVTLAVLLIVPGWSGAERLPLLRPGPAQVTTTPVDLFAGDPARRRLGALTYLGGVELRSPDPVFGGFSSMRVEGTRFTLLSDGGGIVRLTMGRDWQVRDAAARELPGGPGTGWEKRDRDSESMAVLPGGDVLVGFERANALWRYDHDLRRVVGSRAPRSMRKWSANSGPEAVATLPDGSVVVFSESNAKRGLKGFAAIRFKGNPIDPAVPWYGFRYVAPPEFAVTDALALPDGRLLVLVRRFGLPQLFTARLQLVEAGAIRPGAIVTGRTISAFEGDAIHDNFEALALTRENGRDILWVASDDNQAFWQRSLLLKFRLKL